MFDATEFFASAPVVSASRGPVIISENNDIGSINFVAGLSDPGEMIRCGAYQELRRLASEPDTAEGNARYAARIRPLVDALPPADRAIIMGAAIKRAGLDVSNGKIALMNAGCGPDGNENWHDLGTIVRDAVHAKDAVVIGGLAWKVSKDEIKYLNPVTDKWCAVDGRFAVVRSDTGECLGTVGKVYTPFQNDEAFEFLDSVIGEFGAHYETCGSLFGGRKIFMELRIPEKAFRLNGSDENVPYVAFVNSHDGTSTAQCFTTAKRIVCANTMRIARKQTGKKKDGSEESLSIRHNSQLKGRIEAAREALGFAVQKIDKYRESAEVMSKTPIRPEIFFSNFLDEILDISAADSAKGAHYLASVLAVSESEREAEYKKIQKRIDNRLELESEIFTRYNGEKNGVGGMRGTVWSAFNAITESADHGKLGGRINGSGDDARSRKFESVLNGKADELKQVAYSQAINAISA